VAQWYDNNFAADNSSRGVSKVAEKHDTSRTRFLRYDALAAGARVDLRSDICILSGTFEDYPDGMDPEKLLIKLVFTLVRHGVATLKEGGIDGEV
jgi:hypothetical protein